MAASEPGHPIVLFDGHCDFCERSVRFIIQHDRRVVFRFAPLQSATGIWLLGRRDLSQVVVVAGGREWGGAEAAIYILRRLDRPWRWLGVIRVLPGWMLRSGYRWVAWGRKFYSCRSEGCRLTAQMRRERVVDGG